MTFRLGLGVGLIPTAARPAPTAAPENTVAPSFPAPLTQGQTVAINPGEWDGLPSGAFEYMRQRWNGSAWVDVGTFSSSANVTFDAADVSAGADGVRPVVRATNIIGPTTANGVGVTIAAPLAISGSPTPAQVGSPYSFTPDVEGGHAPYTFALTGTLPAGLEFDDETGEISGTAVSSGVAEDLEIEVTDADGLVDTLGPFDLTVSSDGIAAPFTRVNGPTDGQFGPWTDSPYNAWSVDHGSNIADDTEFDVDRQGFTSAGASTTYRDRYYVTRKVRKPWPISRANPSSDPIVLSDSTWALSDFIYSTDTPVGSPTNNSNKVSPKPILKWATLFRGVVGNTIGGATYPIEIVGGHRDARNNEQVACVIFHITDGTTTIDVTVSATSISTNPNDLNSVIVWALPSTDITSLSNGDITVNASGYPWIGGAASVAHSATDGNDARGFSPRYLLKNPTLASAPPIAWVGSGGTAGGTVSTTPATAEAAKFDTIDNAIDGAHAALGGGANGIDGLVIYVDDGTWALASTAGARTQKNGRVTVTRSPTSTNRAAVIVTGGAAVANMNLGTGGSITVASNTGCLRYYDITLQQSGAQGFQSGNATVNLELQVQQCVYNKNGQSGGLIPNSTSAVHLYVDGLTCSATGGQGMSAFTNCQVRLLRGVSADLNNGGGVDGWFLIGSNITRPGNAALTPGTLHSQSKTIIAFNKVPNPQGGTCVTMGSASALIDGAWIAQNLFEGVRAASFHVVGVSYDDNPHGNTHVCLHHNTIIGWYTAARENMKYDEGSTARSSTLGSHVGNIHVGVFHKGDIFRGFNQSNPEGFTALAPSTRLGNWAYMYGVGCKYEFSQFQSDSALNGNEAQAYPGIGTTIGTTWNDADRHTRIAARNTIFTSYAGTTSIFEATGAGSNSTAQAGAGGGTYTLPVGSPARAMVVEPVLAFTLDGAARLTANDHAGALAAA
jgi:hypothetical protein